MTVTVKVLVPALVVIIVAAACTGTLLAVAPLGVVACVDVYASALLAGLLTHLIPS